MPEKQTPETEAQENTPAAQPEQVKRGISAADRAQTIRDYEQEKQKENELDDPESRYSRMRNAIRRPMYNVLLAGALVINPFLWL